LPKFFTPCATTRNTQRKSSSCEIPFFEMGSTVHQKNHANSSGLRLYKSGVRVKLEYQVTTGPDCISNHHYIHEMNGTQVYARTTIESKHAIKLTVALKQNICPCKCTNHYNAIFKPHIRPIRSWAIPPVADGARCRKCHHLIQRTRP